MLTHTRTYIRTYTRTCGRAHTHMHTYTPKCHQNNSSSKQHWSFFMLNLSHLISLQYRLALDPAEKYDTFLEMLSQLTFTKPSEAPVLSSSDTQVNQHIIREPAGYQDTSLAAAQNNHHAHWELNNFKINSALPQFSKQAGEANAYHHSWRGGGGGGLKRKNT